MSNQNKHSLESLTEEEKINYLNALLNITEEVKKTYDKVYLSNNDTSFEKLDKQIIRSNLIALKNTLAFELDYINTNPKLLVIYYEKIKNYSPNFLEQLFSQENLELIFSTGEKNRLENDILTKELNNKKIKI